LIAEMYKEQEYRKFELKRIKSKNIENLLYFYCNIIDWFKHQSI
jgi:hypothetical protein